MFLLFLMGLGAASVKAQVRIGGIAAPNASAVLDLNATDATMNGTKGLALPRVDLTSPTMLLSGVTSNLTGMMVYNTTATLGAIGIYFWNGATWVRASLPSTSAADSGKFLMSNGSTWVKSPLWPSGNVDTVNLTTRARPMTMYILLDTVIAQNIKTNAYTKVPVNRIIQGDFCTCTGGNGLPFVAAISTGYIYLVNLMTGVTATGSPMYVRCYRAVF